MHRWTLAWASLVVLVATPAWGAGLFTPDTGIVAAGRAGAFIASADDNTALYYNPAGLHLMKGFQVRAGLMGLQNPVTFQRAGGEGRYKLDDTGAYLLDGTGGPDVGGTFGEVSNLDKFRPIPEWSISYGFENPDLTIAVGLYAPLAPWISYPLYGANRYRLTKLRLIQGNFAMGLGWRLPAPLDFIAIGGTFQIIYISMKQDFWASADIENTDGSLNPEHPQWDTQTQFEAQQWQPSWNAGLMIIPHHTVRIGLSFAPQYTFRGKGSASLTGELGGEYLEQIKDEFGPLLELAGIDLDTSPLNLVGVDDDVTVTTKQPAILRAGVMVQPTSWLNLELAGTIDFWSRADAIVASDVHVPLQHCDEDGNCEPMIDQVQGRTDPIDPCIGGDGVQLVDCDSLGTYHGTDGEGSFQITQNWKNAFSIRFGGEIQPIPERLGIRFGYAFESSAVPDATLNLTMFDSNKHMVGVGVSGRFEGFEVHFSYAHIFYEPRTITAEVAEGTHTGLEGTVVGDIDDGDYSGSADIIGLSLALDFTTLHRKAKAKKATAERIY